MRAFMQGFVTEIVKLAVGDVGGESPTFVYNDPAEMGAAAIEKTQGRSKNLPGNIARPAHVNVRKPPPAPETTPPSMLGFVP